MTPQNILLPDAAGGAAFRAAVQSREVQQQRKGQGDTMQHECSAHDCGNSNLLLAMASNLLIAIASNLLAMASNLGPSSDGLQPNSFTVELKASRLLIPSCFL